MKKTPYGLATANADLTSIAGVWRAPKPNDDIFVEVDGERYGPYQEATLPEYSANGRHWAFLASNPRGNGRSFDILVVDGVQRAMKTCSGCFLRVDNAGRAFQDVLLTAVDDRAQLHSQYLEGKSLHPGSTPPTVCLSPGGRHYAYPTLAPQGTMVGVDGKTVESGGVPIPLVVAPCAFDGESEYHYWSASPEGRLQLVCGNADGPKAPKTRCEALARSLGWPRVPYSQPPAVAK